MAVLPLGCVNVAGMVRTEMKKTKLLIFVTEDWVFCSHRLSLGEAAVQAGFEVLLVTRVRNHAKLIENVGIRIINLEHYRGRLNLILELWVLLKLCWIYKTERPDLVHHVALKPVLYGSLVASLMRIRQINAITGLGWIFISNSKIAGILGRFLELVLRYTLSGSICILQNPDDVKWIEKLQMKNPSIRLIPGAGVDIQKFHQKNKIVSDGLVVMLLSRMLYDKGVVEFVEAARLLREKGQKARFVLVGNPDLENRGSVSLTKLEEWQRNGLVEWWGHSDDVAGCYNQAAIACLPSYREGLPKSLLEAAACGLPIVTTDVPGCREVVNHEDNGLLVPVKNSIALAEALRDLLENSELRQRMGKRSREIVEKKFDVKIVIDATLSVYREALI